MSQYIPSHKGDSVDINSTLGGYATKDDLKNLIGTDISSFALKTNLADLKPKVDKLNTDRGDTMNELIKISGAKLFHNFAVSTISNKMFDNSEINSYITDFVTKLTSSVKIFSENLTLSTAGDDLDKETKSLSDDFDKKIDNVVKKEGKPIRKSDLDAELKRIQDEIKNLKDS